VSSAVSSAPTRNSYDTVPPLPPISRMKAAQSSPNLQVATLLPQTPCVTCRSICQPTSSTAKETSSIRPDGASWNVFCSHSLDATACKGLSTWWSHTCLVMLIGAWEPIHSATVAGSFLPSPIPILLLPKLAASLTGLGAEERQHAQGDVGGSRPERAGV